MGKHLENIPEARLYSKAAMLKAAMLKAGWTIVSGFFPDLIKGFILFRGVAHLWDDTIFCT
ncbi:MULTISPECIES: hypothetical protein [Moorena]|uniref:hypothetical protein n=1 Tax=unclassified Moorena TaxID=2683338 RepID=UPI000967BB8D|nr:MULTISPECIES: hypothetical protein [Moorena]NEQ12436.1 hypothetical protein [Moorena sp. SIO3E2]NER88473.1 hypothetical protein [Moorena sp. SIO3A2]NES40023.1 hypothetical protein [Moorena sp. SIO2C4]OLT68698.1 hypothetical protein BI334_30110 [Moorena producens 3L]